MLVHARSRTTRRLLARAWRAWLRLRARPFTRDELRADAVVLVPHPDDESLGLGATIAQKRRAGARVALIVVTRGEASHPRIAPDAMAQRRARELERALAILGVTEVHRLTFPDGEVAAHRDALTAAIVRVLDAEPWRQLFVPHPRDGHPDHRATFDAAMRASDGRSLQRFGYPVWAYATWPHIDGAISFATLATEARTFTRRCGDQSAIDRKHAAIRAHESQVSTHDPDVPSLAAIFDGDLMRCLDGHGELLDEL